MSSKEFAHSVKLKCVSGTTFGVPVEPDVNESVATSVSFNG